MTTPNKKESWEEKLKPRVTVFSEEQYEQREIAQTILYEYWEKLKPQISSLLKDTKKEMAREIVEEIEKLEKNKCEPHVCWHENCDSEECLGNIFEETKENIITKIKSKYES